MWGFYKRRPRRPGNGIKAQSKQFGKTWWASRWLQALYELIDPARLARGRSYARSGQVLNLDIQTGQVNARVQGSYPQPYAVSIKIKPLSATEWTRVADAMSAQALFAAKLLAGEMPQDIEKAFAVAGVNLFPTELDDMETDCSCPDWSNPCKHIAAVYLLLGEQFDSDPFLLFRLRGKSKTDIIAMLRARRSAQETPVSPKSKNQQPRKKRERPEPVAPLESLVTSFWSADDLLADFKTQIQAPELDAAPIKRLGSPGFWHSKRDFVQTFTAHYQSATKAALELIQDE